jgi:ubiquinone/menaquinone biosynthesis C-methylase UbiE
MEDKEVQDQVREQFGKTAEAYLVRGEIKEKDLLRMIQAAAVTGQERVLDIGTATGRTLLAFAPYIAEGVGLDLTPEMLAIADREAKASGVTNVSWQEGDVERLPFADGSFDLVTARICAHHFPKLDRAVQEMARVLKPGGRLLVIDNYAPEQDAADSFINTIEKWRDGSHVREWKLSEWQKFYEGAGLTFAVDNTYRTRMRFGWWTARAQTPAELLPQIQQAIADAAADPAICAEFDLRQTDEGEWTFELLKALLVGSKKESAE